MLGKRYELWVKSISGKWLCHSMFAQSKSWLDKDKEFFEKLGLKTRVDEHDCEYDDR